MSAIPKCSPQSQLKVVGGSCKWSLIVIVLSGFRPHNPVTFAHCYLHPPPPIRVYGVNNKSCVTSQITQTAYHLFIVVYHNNSSVRTKATASQTQALLMNLEDYQIWKLTHSVAGFFPLVYVSPFFFCFPNPPETKKTVMRSYRKYVALFAVVLSVFVQLNYTVVGIESQGQTTDWTGVLLNKSQWA